MSQTKAQIQSHLASAGSQPRHRFGQNFMIDQNLVRIIADSASITPNDLVIEVGPGTGTLTDEILTRASDMVAVEIDRDLAAHLRNHHSGNPKFRLIEGDALDGKHAVHPELAAMIQTAISAGKTVKLVANLPYNIASPLVIELLLLGVSSLVFTVQKEVADRLQATPTKDDYGPLTIIVQMLSEVEVLRTIPPQAFWPAPKIDSALVRCSRRDLLGPHAPAFSLFVQKLYSFRRKTLRKALDMMEIKADQVLADMGIDPTIRAECFTPVELYDLFKNLTAK